jgi:hypothetical protein
VLAQMKIETGIDLHQLLDAAELLEHLVGHPLPARIDRSLLAEPGHTAADDRKQARTGKPSKPGGAFLEGDARSASDGHS